MNWCADLLCTCGKHACLQRKYQDNVIKPIVFKHTIPISETKEKYVNFSPEPIETTSNFNCMKSFETPTDNILRHPPTKKYQCYQSDPICNTVGEKSCGHGDYFPKSNKIKEKDCHPEKPKMLAEINAVEAEKECKECDGVFQCDKSEPPCELCPNVFSLWQKRTPLKPMKLQECEPLPEWDASHQVLQSCCRCCSCRGCPSCTSRQECHPCDISYGSTDGACVAAKCRDADRRTHCEKHPAGCYFVPRLNADLSRIK